jgi:hypothetical protein
MVKAIGSTPEEEVRSGLGQVTKVSIPFILISLALSINWVA